MKGLSLTQPWASLVAIGAKRIETRSWSTSYRGPIAIHASKGFPRWARETCDDEPFYGVLVKAGLLWPIGDETLTHRAVERYAALPLGAIVAVANLTRVFRAEDIATVNEEYGYGGGRLLPHELEFGDYGDGRFAWVLTDVVQLPEPIPCKGALGLWDVAADVEALIEQQLARRAS